MRGRGWSAVLIAGLIAVTAACSTEQLDQLMTLIQPAQAVVRGEARGEVRDEGTRTPLAGVKLAVGQTRTVSGSDGSYVTSGLPAGTHFVKAEHAGYQTYFGEVQIGLGTTRFDILMRPQGETPALPASI